MMMMILHRRRQRKSIPLVSGRFLAKRGGGGRRSIVGLVVFAIDRSDGSSGRQ